MAGPGNPIFSYAPKVNNRRLEEWIKPGGFRAVVLVAVILVLGVGVFLILRAVGGMPHTHAHLMYIPIALGAAAFGRRGGIATGLLAGLAIGPLMPADIVTGEPQLLAQWVERLLAFMVIGGLFGAFVTTLRNQTLRNRWLAFHDPVTGVPNRRAMDEILRSYISEFEPNGETFVLVVANINNYREFLHSFGPAFADDLLVAFIERVKNSFQETIIPCQLETSRVVFALPKGSASEERLSEVLDASKEPFRIRDVPVYVDISLGRAEFPRHAKDAEALITKANIAMYQALESGRRDVVYDIESDTTRRYTLSILASLPAALKDEHVHLVYQPQFSLSRKQSVGVEALIRWDDPERGRISPGDFIPPLENTHLIHDVTRWVLDNSLAQLKRYEAEGFSTRMAINVSARNLAMTAFPKMVQELLDRYRVDPGSLELEVTESAIMANPAEASRFLSAVRETGVTIAIDDFGTGQTALSQLSNLPFDMLKIDQYFVRRILTHEVERELVVALIGLAQRFGWSILAEGVEDEDTSRRLQALGCDLIQGYYISKPLAAEESIAFLRESR